MPDEFAPIGPARPATADDLYNALVAADAIVGKQRARIAELEAALAAAVDAVVRRGEAVHWDELERQLVAAHDALPTAD